MRAQKVAFVREHTGQAPFERLQGTPQKLAKKLGQNPFVDGNLVKGLTFAAGTALTVNHGLGRKVSGYFVVRNYGTNVANVVGESGASPLSNDRQINLVTTVACTVDVWFF